MRKTTDKVKDIMKQNHESKEPNDGSFISVSEKDSFNMNGTVRYGEEADNCDL